MYHELLLFKKIYLILLNLYISFILVHSNKDIETQFTHTDFYESFSRQKECFKILHNYPTGPRFLLISIDYELTRNSTKKPEKYVYKKYQLKRVDLCDSSITIPKIGKNYTKIKLRIEFYLYNGEKSVDTSLYIFYDVSNLISLIIISKNNRFGLLVYISHSEDENSVRYKSSSPLVKSYLMSIPKTDNSLCLIIGNNSTLILRPENMHEERGLITRIRAEYVKDGIVTFSEEYAAFECKQNDDDIEPVFLIYDGDNIEIHISYIYLKFYENYTLFRIVNTFFINIYLIKLQDIKILSVDAKKFYFLPLNCLNIFFPNNNIISVSKSKKDYIFSVLTYKMVNVSSGIQRMCNFCLPKLQCK